MTELTGNVIDQYEEEFRRLYKKSLAVNTRVVLSPQASQASTPTPVCVKVVPSRAQTLGVNLNSLIPAASVTSSATNPLASRPASCSTSTQTLNRLVTQGTQTDLASSYRPRVLLSSTSLFEADSSGSESTCSTPTEANPLPQMKAPQSAKPCPTQPPYLYKLSSLGLSHDQQKRQQNAVPSSSILSQSNHMVSSLSTRKDILDWSSSSIRSVLQRGCKVQQSTRPGPGLTLGSMLMTTPVRSRYLQ